VDGLRLDIAAHEQYILSTATDRYRIRFLPRFTRARSQYTVASKFA